MDLNKNMVEGQIKPINGISEELLSVFLSLDREDFMPESMKKMAYVEKITREELDEELASYNPLVPNGRELTATMMIEIDDPLRRKIFYPDWEVLKKKLRLLLEILKFMQIMRKM